MAIRIMGHLAKRLTRESAYFRRIASDARTPKTSKYMLTAALAYLASPIDLIPDFIPIVGHVDDVLVVSALIWVALRTVPDEVKADARRASKHAP